jgi:hypothetical protein
MLGRGVGLVEVVERCQVSPEAFRFDMRKTAREATDEILRLLRAGLFDEACRLRGFTDDDLDYFDEQGEWWEFMDVVDLADALDNFLAVLEADRRAAALARDCRGELDLLLVLADLCEDAGLPRAAAEARHYHGLVESLWRR